MSAATFEYNHTVTYLRMSVSSTACGSSACSEFYRFYDAMRGAGPIQTFQTSFMTSFQPHEPRLAPKGLSGRQSLNPEQPLYYSDCTSAATGSPPAVTSWSTLKADRGLGAGTRVRRSCSSATWIRADVPCSAQNAGQHDTARHGSRVS